MRIRRRLSVIFCVICFCSFPLVAQPDWLIDPSGYNANISTDTSNEIELSNGLVRRVFRISPNAATVALDNLVSGQSFLRGVKPEAIITIDGVTYEVGGLKGQPNYAYLNPEWLATMASDSLALQFQGYEVGEPVAPFEWGQVRHAQKDASWPPKGVQLRMDYDLPEVQATERPRLGAGDLSVSVYYELYDGLPVIAKWMTITNQTDSPIVLEKFTSEILAAVEYASVVDAREFEIPTPNIHVETDYAFASMMAKDANHHAVRWVYDPDYHTQVSYEKLTPCLLNVGPELGPNVTIASGETFESFRTFVLPHESYDRERQGLAMRRMYRTLAPWSTENPLMMHARFADWERVKTAIDQAAEVGFEMVILTFGSGFNIEDDSEEYIQEMQRYADYAKSKGVEIGGYSLLASRKVGGGNDVVMPEGMTPTFGNSPCIESEWGEVYFRKLYNFYEKTGFALLEHDGSYPGDVCASEDHPGHKGLEDSRWRQYQTISKFYKWCREQGIYLNIPDYYYMTGGNKCAMGYREVNWSLPRSQQLVHARQNIFDGTWEKAPSMGWMFVPLTEYHGGGAAATVEPLHEHLPHYEMMMMSNLGGGVQACYRGPRLFDTEETQEMVKSRVDWFKEHREVLEGDIIHLRRADGRDIDYWLNVNPGGEEKGLLMVFNPTSQRIIKDIKVPVYYTGLTDKVTVEMADGTPVELELSRDYAINLSVEVPANSYTWAIMR